MHGIEKKRTSNNRMSAETRSLKGSVQTYYFDVSRFERDSDEKDELSGLVT